MSIFYLKNGNNGATYIFNIKSTYDIKKSLEFYKTFSIKQKLIRFSLIIYLLIIRFFRKSSTQSVPDIVKYLDSISNKKIEFNINQNSSILISPTRDKIIIHNHLENSFTKYGFNKSKKNIDNEYKIYNLIRGVNNKFNISRIEAFKSKEHYSTFKLINKNLISKDSSIEEILAEFFNISSKTKISINDYLKKELDNSYISKYNDFLINTYNNIEIPLGLVHKDFKPWNIELSKGPLIYDFEEAIENGVIGEDLLNYYFDPIITTNNLSSIDFKIIEQRLNTYKKLLKSNLDNEVLVFIYFITNYLELTKRNHIEIAKRNLIVLDKYINYKEIII